MKVFVLLVLSGMGLSLMAHAEAPAQIQLQLAEQARAANPSFREFSPQRGQSLFQIRQGGDWSCVTCHTANPARRGQHAVTQKIIQPLAPAANPERFTDLKKVEKWFKRNCNDVLNRACTAQEKGDVIAYLLTVRP